MANFIPRIMLTFAVLASISAVCQAPRMLDHVNSRVAHILTRVG